MLISLYCLSQILYLFDQTILKKRTNFMSIYPISKILSTVQFMASSILIAGFNTINRYIDFFKLWPDAQKPGYWYSSLCQKM